jgi:hypothetical protein
MEAYFSAQAGEIARIARAAAAVAIRSDETGESVFMRDGILI